MKVKKKLINSILFIHNKVLIGRFNLKTDDQKTTLTYNISTITFYVALQYIIVFFYFNLYISSLISVIFTLGFYVSSALNYYGQYTCAKYVLFFNGLICLVFFSCFLGKECGAYLLLFGMTGMPVLMFQTDQKKIILSLTGCPVFLFLLLEATNYNLIPYSEPVSVHVHTLIYSSAGLSTFALIFFQVFVYREETEHLTQKLQKALKKEGFLRLKQKEVLTKERDIAKQLQFGLMPQEAPQYDHFNVTVDYQSCNQVGGNYYDFIPYRHNEVLGIIADIGGKNIPASMMMMHFRNLIHKFFKKDRALSTFIEALNNQVVYNRFIQKSVACTLWKLNAKTNQLSLVTAGMNPSILIHNNHVTLLDTAGGVPLGMFENSFYTPIDIQLQPNDKILCFTDGIVDQKNKHNQHYGYDPFIQLVKRHATLDNAKMIDAITSEIKEFSGSTKQSAGTLLMAMHYTSK